jgi:hypothetical protein
MLIAFSSAVPRSQPRDDWSPWRVRALIAIRSESSEQILKPFEDAGVDKVEKRMIEQNPPVRRCLLDHAQVRRCFCLDSPASVPQTNCS